MHPELLIKHLSRPQAYPQRPVSVRHLETHISVLFFAGGFVYKVKKPVHFDFLDARNLEQRLHYCREEVRLNESLAPSIYMGVIPICLAADGTLAVEGKGEIVEYAVKMRELPEHRMLTNLLASGDIDNQKLRDIAAVLARFHREAATGPGVNEHGAPESVRRLALDNFRETTDFTKPGRLRTISPTLHGFLSRATRQFLDSNDELFGRRVLDGRIREGHGDLHAGNICILKGRVGTRQTIIIYDRIEFSAAFRCGDVANDLSFLLMDLDRMGYAGFSGFLLQEYVGLAADPEARELVDFYKTYRAMVRGKVTSLRLAQMAGPDAEVEASRARAAEYFYLAASYALPPALILTCGLPGSGKSFLAGHLAKPLRARVLNSDRVRKRLAGLAPTESAKAPFGEGIYDASSTRRTYARLLAMAEETMRHGRTVIVDAGFRVVSQRRPFLEMARQGGFPLLVLEVDVPEHLLRERLERRENRARDQVEVSDADLSILDRVRAGFEKPAEVPEQQRLVWTGNGGLDKLVADVVDRLVRSVQRSDQDTRRGQQQ